MYFNVYFDPQVISVANTAGELGLQSLTGILRGFLQNCFIAEFTDYRIQPEINSYLSDLPETSDRSTLKKIFKKLDADNRFIYCLRGDSDPESTAAMKIAANRELVDVILLGHLNDELSGFTDMETETLVTYQNSNFESLRSELAGKGVALEPLSMNGREFLDRYLKRALQHAQRIDIIDKLLLLKYRSNFRYTLQHFFEWFESTVREPSKCRIILHSAYNDDEAALNELRTDLQAFKVGNLAYVIFEVEFYDGAYYADSLPHDRFILTDQIAVGVPRGMDIFVEEDYEAKIRDVSLDCKGKKDIEDLLASYSTHHLPDRKIVIA